MPSGRKNGQRCEVCRAASTFVIATGVPPLALTRMRGAERSRGEQDHSTRSPGAPATERYVTNYLRRAYVEVDGFELALGEESEGTAIGRPERKNRALGAGQCMRFQPVRGAYPERRLAVSARGRKRDRRTIGRKHRRTGRIACQIECGLLRRINDGADRTRGLSRMVEEHDGSRSQNNRSHQGRGPTKTLTGCETGRASSAQRPETTCRPRSTAVPA